MSEDNPDVPNIPPPPDQDDPAPQPPKSGSIGVGFVLGTVALLAVYVGGGVGQGPYAPSARFLALPVPFIPVVVYMAVAIVLAIVPRTARYGAGMLIGMGFFILLDGFCLGSLARHGNPT